MASNPIAWAATPADVANLPRNAVHDMIDRLIGWLDEGDGDPDLEETDAEDSFLLSFYASGDGGPGCPVSDQDGPAWIERVDQRRDPYAGHGPATIAAAEDAEDDDPAEDSDEDRCLAGDDGVYAGTVMGGGGYHTLRHGEDIGSEEDAEDGGDTELNGDEGDHSEGY